MAERQIGADIENAEVVRDPFNVNYNVEVPWPGGDCLRLASVGRLHPQSKGQDLLLQALSSPEWGNRDWHLTFFGDGPHKQGLELMAQRLGLASHVTFAGHVNSVSGIWAENHALVMPSRYEGLPLSMVEAMLCARPVLATDVAGHAEVVTDNVLGFIAGPPAVASLQDTLERLWIARGRLEEMGQAAAKEIREKVPPSPEAVFADKLVALVG